MFPRKEWTAIPELSKSNYDMVHHSVTAIDYGILNGKKRFIYSGLLGAT